MPDLSVKGIARKYLTRSPPFSLKDIFGITTAYGSLRPRLESWAREEHSFHWEEDCSTGKFVGDAKFEQIWTHIVVRINLNFDATIQTTTRNSLMTTWRDTIQKFWSLKWGCTADGEATCRLTFEVQWISDFPHHTVAITPCATGTTCRENSGRWFDNTTGNTAAHEFGHLLGLKDEYTPLIPTECPVRSPVNTGTVMDGNVECFPDRLMTHFADNIGSEIAAISEYTHNAATCT
jgi:hypothetical protein